MPGSAVDFSLSTAPSIVRAGHYLLRQKALKISDPSSQIVEVLESDMLRAMKKAGGVGLAAPQIAVGLRAIIFWLPEQRVTNVEGDRPMPPIFLINPTFIPLDSQQSEGWEGCLSIPGLQGLVPRYRRIGYHGFDRQGRVIEREACGFHACVVQHELDHLDGILYPQRMTNIGSLGYVEELAAARSETTS